MRFDFRAGLSDMSRIEERLVDREAVDLSRDLSEEGDGSIRRRWLEELVRLDDECSEDRREQTGLAQGMD